MLNKTLLLFCTAAFVLLLLVVPSFADAQNDVPGYYTQGEKLFKQKRYYEAIQYYEKYLGTEKKVTPRSQPFAVKKKAPGKSNLNIHHEVVYHLAECYRLINNYTLAEKWYKEAMSFSRAAYPACGYWYGVSLRANQKYEEAFHAISSFRESYSTMDELLVGADKELENLKFIREQLLKERDGFFITRNRNVGQTTAYAPAEQQDNIVFTSVYADSSAQQKGKDYYFSRLYESQQEDGRGGAAKRMPITEEEGVNNGLATFSKDRKKIFFTRWVTQNGANISAIYSSDKTDTGWTKPVKAPDPINMDGSNSTQPFITPDGKYLLFSSNREGGVGKYDIWYASIDSNYNPLLVYNAGNIVNTASDDVAPSYHQTSRTLLFSSNGHVGMGGFDIFQAKGDFQLSNWDKPINAGTPINSSKDDLYFISTDEDNLWNTGWLSSDRATDCCLELFSVRQDNAQYISGSVVDCNTQAPVAGVELTIKDPKHGGKIIQWQQTDSEGKYSFELRNTSRFEVVTEKAGYNPVNESYTVHFETGQDSVHNKPICISVAVLNNARQELEDALYALSESSTLAKFSFNQSSLGNGSFYQLDSLAELMTKLPNIIIEVGGYTDSKGSESYNLELAQKRVDACIRYLVNKGIGRERLVGKAYGECCPLEPEKIDGKDNPAARQRNRRVEYKLANR
ncbi:MAG TPA: OmpA family protein [Agriterribacter sp.]|nr:OmpA family protein [Agriterribacter sp.]